MFINVRSKGLYIISTLSLINWIPVIIYSGFKISAHKIWMILLPACLLTPIISVICIISIIIITFIKKTSVIIGCIIIVINLVYLFWGLSKILIVLTMS